MTESTNKENASKKKRYAIFSLDPEDGDFDVLSIKEFTEIVEAGCWDSPRIVVTYEVEQNTFFAYWDTKDPHFISLDYERQDGHNFAIHYSEEVDCHHIYDIESWLEEGEKLWGET